MRRVAAEAALKRLFLDGDVWLLFFKLNNLVTTSLMTHVPPSGTVS